jgi:hypothetical protein
VQLPKNWVQSEESENGLQLEEPAQFGRQMTLLYRPRDLILKMSGNNTATPPRSAKPIRFGNLSGSYWTSQRSDPIPTAEGIRRVRTTLVNGSVDLSDGGAFQIIISNPSIARPAQTDESIELLKRVAETIQLLKAPTQ